MWNLPREISESQNICTEVQFKLEEYPPTAGAIRATGAAIEGIKTPSEHRRRARIRKPAIPAHGLAASCLEVNATVG